MSGALELREVIDLPGEIREAGLDAKLVLFIGSGISQLAGYPSWDEFANEVLDDLRKKKFINFSEKNQLVALDPRKKLSIARIIAKNHEYKLNFASYFTGRNEDNTIYKLINDIGCPCVTTNYDELLAPRFIEDKGSGIPAQENRVYERKQFHEELLSKPGTVVHLHGAISNPDTMIVTIEDYLKCYANKNVKNLLDVLFKKHTILFLGYGLEEAEILEHILKRGSTGKVKREQKLFSLQGFFESEKYLYENIYNYYEKSFGVHLLGFLRDNEDFHCQERIIKEWMQTLKTSKQTDFDWYKNMNEVLK